MSLLWNLGVVPIYNLVTGPEIKKCQTKNKRQQLSWVNYDLENIFTEMTSSSIS